MVRKGAYDKAMSAHILIVDDEKDIRTLLKEILEDEGYRASEAAHSEAALAVMQQDRPKLIILDIWLENSDMDGMEILEHVRKTHPDIPVLMISGHGNIEMAVKAMKLGAYEFIEKPFNSDRLLMMIERALETGKLMSENIGLKRKIDVFDEFTSVDPRTVSIRQTIDKVAQSGSRVMVSGPSGSGKTLIARTIHDLSSQAKGPFVILECASFASEGEDSQKRRIGDAFTQAKGGTCVLQNVHEMPRSVQAYLVQYLQSPESNGQMRLISTALGGMAEAVKAGRFREDLFYRLNVVNVDVPPVRERKQDIPEIASYYLRKFFAARGKEAPRFQDDAIVVLQKFEWPGNVRQIKNTIENVAMTHLDSGLKVLKAEHLPADIRGYIGGGNGAASGEASRDIGTMLTEWLGLPLKEARACFEKFYIESQMDRFDGNISKAADFIGMERTALHRKIKSLEEVEGASAGQNGSSGVQDMPAQRAARGHAS